MIAKAGETRGSRTALCFFSNVFYTSGIHWNETFEIAKLKFEIETFSRVHVLKFCSPSPNFEGNWREGPPYFDPIIFSPTWLYLNFHFKNVIFEGSIINALAELTCIYMRERGKKNQNILPQDSILWSLDIASYRDLDVQKMSRNQEMSCFRKCIFHGRFQKIILIFPENQTICSISTDWAFTSFVQEF